LVVLSTNPNRHQVDQLQLRTPPQRTDIVGTLITTDIITTTDTAHTHVAAPATAAGRMLPIINHTLGRMLPIIDLTLPRVLLLLQGLPPSP
jgi:hypothetical protein